MARPRKPSALKILEGTHRKDRDGAADAEPQPTGVPQKPSGLKEHASKLWDDLIPQLTALGVATSVDGPALGEMCQWFDRYIRWGEALDKMGIRAKTHYRLTVQVSMASKRFQSIASRFGLTPADRTKIMVRETPGDSGVWARKRGG